MVEQRVETYIEELVTDIAERIREEIEAGWKVVACSYASNPEQIYSAVALVVYEKALEKRPSPDMSTGMDWSNECSCRVFSGPDIDAEVNISRKTMRDYIKNKFGPGSVRND